MWRFLWKDLGSCLRGAEHCPYLLTVNINSYTLPCNHSETVQWFLIYQYLPDYCHNRSRITCFPGLAKFKGGARGTTPLKAVKWNHFWNVHTSTDHLISTSSDWGMSVPGSQAGKCPQWLAGREAPRSPAWSRPAGSLWSGRAASQTEGASMSLWRPWSWERLPPPSWEELQALQHNTQRHLEQALRVYLSFTLACFHWVRVSTMKLNSSA